MKRVTNRTKATTAGILGGALVSWIAYKAQSQVGIPAEVAAEVIAPVVGGFTGLIARWAAKLDPSR